MPSTKRRKGECIKVRVTAMQKQVLQGAADVTHANLSEFVLQTSLTEAGILVSSRTRFLLEEDQWNCFVKALDAPPTPRPALYRLMNEPSVLEG